VKGSTEKKFYEFGNGLVKFLRSLQFYLLNTEENLTNLK